jgi:hypothetical protein
MIVFPFLYKVLGIISYLVIMENLQFLFFIQYKSLEVSIRHGWDRQYVLKPVIYTETQKSPYSVLAMSLL